MPSRRKKQDPLVTLITVVVLLLLLLIAGVSGFNNLGAAFVVIVTVGILISVVGLVVLWRWQIGKQRALRALRIADVDSMAGVDFEKYVGAIFKSKGYRVKYTGLSGDFGVDVLAEKGQEKIAVQVKRYKKLVGEAAVQQAVAGMYHYGCNKAMVVTNSRFTTFAQELAKTTHCELIDRPQFSKWVLEFQNRDVQERLEALS